MNIEKFAKDNNIDKSTLLGLVDGVQSRIKSMGELYTNESKETQLRLIEIMTTHYFRQVEAYQYKLENNVDGEMDKLIENVKGLL